MERRKFITGAAVAGGVAWTAPSILSVDAVAAATPPPPVPPAFRGTFAAPGGFGATVLTINVPAGTFSVGDYLLALGMIRFTNAKNAGVAPPSITPPNAWTPVFPTTFSPTPPSGVTSRPVPLPASTTVALRGQVFGYRYNGEATFTFNKTNDNGSPTAWGVLLVGYSGVNATSPLDGAAGQGALGLTVTAPSITTTTPGTRLVYLGGAFGPTTWTNATTLTTRAEGPSVVGHPEGFVADEVLAAAGATGTRSMTIVAPPDTPAQLDHVAFNVGLRGV